MRAMLFVSTLACFGYVILSTNSASADAVKDRQEVMKGVGAATKATGAMVQGKSDYDGAKAAEAMNTIAAAPDKFVTLFPAGSKGDPDSEAADKIWDDTDGFKKVAASLKADATAAAGAAGKGLDDFKAAWGKMVKNCKICHETYRIKKQ